MVRRAGDGIMKEKSGVEPVKPKKHRHFTGKGKML